MGILQCWTILLINNLRMYANDKMGIIGDIYYCGVYFQFTLILSVSTFILHWYLVSTFILHWYLQFLLSFYSHTFNFYFHNTLILSVSTFILQWFFLYWYFHFLFSFYIDTFTLYFHFTVILSLCTFILQWYVGVCIDKFRTLHPVQYTCKITYVTWSWYLQWCSRCQN